MQALKGQKSVEEGEMKAMKMSVDLEEMKAVEMCDSQVTHFYGLGRHETA